MKTNKFINFESRFGLFSFLHPDFGGPSMALSRVLNCYSPEYYAQFASKIRFAGVRPFKALNMKAVSTWELTDESQACMSEPTYHKALVGPPRTFFPVFQGDGEIYGVIYEVRDPLPGLQLHAWAPIDTVTSVEELMLIAAKYYDSAVSTAQSFWRALYVLRTSWKKENPNRFGYDIYILPILTASVDRKDEEMGLME